MKERTSTTATLISLFMILLMWYHDVTMEADAFSLHPSSSRRHDRSTTTTFAKHNKKHDRESEPAFPQLPAIGGTSVSSFPPSSSSAATSPNQEASTTATKSVEGNFVSPKFQLQYTCNVCNTRNTNMVSRIAYTEGVVVAICKGCKSKHLIADNLSSGLQENGGDDRTIEDYFQNTEDEVHRVGKDVFQLDSLWHVDTKGGTIVGEDGTTMLE